MGKGGYAGKIILLVVSAAVFTAVTVDLSGILPEGIYAKLTDKLPFLKMEKKAEVKPAVNVAKSGAKTEEETTEPVAKNPKTADLIKKTEEEIERPGAENIASGARKDRPALAIMGGGINAEAEKIKAGIREELVSAEKTAENALDKIEKAEKVEKAEIAGKIEKIEKVEKVEKVENGAVTIETEIIEGRRPAADGGAESRASAGGLAGEGQAAPGAEVASTAGSGKTAEENVLESLTAAASKATVIARAPDVYYTKNLNVKVYENPENVNKVADTLAAGVRVILLEQKEVVVETEKRSTDKDGKLVTEKIKNSSNWEKITYRKNNKENTGWIREKNLTEDLHDAYPESWKDLDFYPVEKKNYPDNPRTAVKGIYVSSSSAGLESRMEKLIALTKRSDINAFVIDVKDDSGHLLFKMDGMEKYSESANKFTQIRDMAAFMQKLKDNNIYAIARIVSFRDPSYAKTNPDKVVVSKSSQKPYTNDDKLPWISPHDRNMWEYNIRVAKEAAKAGFNEIQFDYVRFPAADGGKLDNTIDYRNTQKESKPVAIQKYLEYARAELEPLGIYISADVFGQIGSLPDDMQIGQFWEAVSNTADYISPMMYPSHYKKGVYGINVPDKEPYNVIYRGTRDAINRNENLESPAGIRPWLQAFTAKWLKEYLNYGYEEIEQQIMALADLGIQEYILWNPSNVYTMVEKNPPAEEQSEAAKSEVKPAASTPAAKPEAKPAAPAPAAKPEAKPETPAPAAKPEAKPATPAPEVKPEAKPATPAPATKPATTAPAGQGTKIEILPPKPAAKPAPKPEAKPKPAAQPKPAPKPEEKPIQPAGGGKLIDRYKKALNP
jgi:hypothetical protein